MVNPYVVICAAPWLRDAVDIVALCLLRSLGFYFTSEQQCLVFEACSLEASLLILLSQVSPELSIVCHLEAWPRAVLFLSLIFRQHMQQQQQQHLCWFWDQFLDFFSSFRQVSEADVRSCCEFEQQKLLPFVMSSYLQFWAPWWKSLDSGPRVSFTNYRSFRTRSASA